MGVKGFDLEVYVPWHAEVVGLLLNPIGTTIIDEIQLDERLAA